MKKPNLYLELILDWIVISILALLITSAVLMWLWNIIIVYLFGLPTLTYGYAIGLKIISNLLFKSNTYFRDNRKNDSK